jgi:predicted transcriptional regulator
MYKLPQEIEVWYIIPKIRKELAKVFVEKKGFSYDQTAKILGITKAAVSQYLKNKRANKIKFSKEMQKEVENATERISKNPISAMTEIQGLLKKMKESKCSCDVCKKYNKEVLAYCNCKPIY